MSVLASATTHRELVENLVLRDIKARYKQSVLGYAWAVFNPLIYALIYTLVGRYIFRQDTHIPFPVFAYYGLLFWNLFSTGLATATESLIANLSLITKVYFPREVFPLSAVASKLVDFAFGLVGLIPLLFFFHATLSVTGILLIVPIVVILLLLTAGIGMLCACANLFYRDVRYLVGLATNLVMYLVPNLYPVERVPEKLRTLYLLNPMAALIEAARRATFPQSGPLEPIVPFVISAALVSLTLFVLGFWVFKRNEPRFAEFI